MKRRLTAVCVALLVALGFSSLSFAVTMNLMTGREKGTYYQFGLNLQQLVKPKGIELGVQPSTGSIENLYAVFKRPNTQIGIVQSDVLAFVSRVQTNPTLMRIAQKTKMVFPLYNEEVHLLGRRDIADFDNLTGKRVAVGEDGSGTFLTARLLFEVSGVKPGEIVTVGTDEALSQLKANKIDAMFYVAGLPVKLFNEGVTDGDGLALIPITNRKAAEFYQQTRIPAGTYPWQRAEVSTVAVKAVLVSFDFRNLDCESVGRFAQILHENISWLRENGHPKWKSVDLDFPLKGWEQYDCVRKYLVKKGAPPPPAVKPAGDINPIMEAVKEMLNR
ncbi:MAG: TAXI family TRAP transporter solute-binding subunit [Hyphomicrobiales bacterium]